MAARRVNLPPELQQAAKQLLGRVTAEAQNALARASSAMFQSLATDAKQVPAKIREEAAKLEGMLDGFIQSIASEPADAQDDAAETARQTPRAKKRKKARKTRRKL